MAILALILRGVNDSSLALKSASAPAIFALPSTFNDFSSPLAVAESLNAPRKGALVIGFRSSSLEIASFRSRSIANVFG